ncbi:MAG: hypothetical protein ACPGO3_02525 [Magnetospiraceae bacterium]
MPKRMRLSMTVAGVLVASTALTGCVQEQQPTIAHTHIGHALTGWVDTPDKRGLLLIAEEEAAIGADHAGFAIEAAATPELMREHVGHVLHAYTAENDNLTETPGLGYGTCKALIRGLDHMRFAAESPDVTQNARDGIKDIDAKAKTVVDRCNTIVALAHEIRRNPNDEEALVLTDELAKLTEQVLVGVDANRNGTIENSAKEYGIRGILADINAMTARENPPYAPVAERWLFGLIRLPDGTWQFKTQTASGFDPTGAGSGGGGGGGGGY